MGAKATAIVLLSGGLDSATTLAIALSEGYDCHALSFNYRQRHDRELSSAIHVAKHYGLKEHKIVRMDLREIGGSALTDESIAVPEGREVAALKKDIPTTYVPARNIIFLSVALGYAEVCSADAIFIGANAIDYSGYPDCRQDFLEAFAVMGNKGTKRGVEGHPIAIKYPLINMTKAQIVKKGLELKVPYELTWSCYKGGKRACGKCDSCQLRLKGFAEAGSQDPIEYSAKH